MRFGTCYAAETDLGAYLEVFGRVGTVPVSLIESRSLSHLRCNSSIRLANLTDPRAAGFSVNASFSADKDYGHSQQLASVLFAHGFQGIRYYIRHDPSQSLTAVALFYEPGQHETYFDQVDTKGISLDLIDRAETNFAIKVLHAPPL